MLAHEKVLQALIAFMARADPRFVDHLRERFVDLMSTSRHEHGYRETDDYAEEFIRAVMLLGEAPAPQSKAPKVTDEHPASPKDQERQDRPEKSSIRRDRVQVRERNGIWEVKVDGKFRGDYHQQEHALAAAALLKLSQ